MASKSGQPEPEKAEVIDELLDALDTALDRVRVLYEQYFLGIQKQPPAYLHTEVERRIRDLTQLQIRNTAQRYRFATLQQKFGSYNSYWRRTLRQIEHGTYARSLLKIGRQAARTGAAVPEEILAAMPRRMREQVVRDREAALALAGLRERQRSGGDAPARTGGGPDIADLGAEDADADLAGFSGEPTDARPSPFLVGGAHPIDESDADFDVDAFFASVILDSPPPALEPDDAASTAEPAPPPRTTGQMRAVIARVKTESVPTTEVAQPRRTTGQMRAVTPRAKTDPGASAAPVQSARVTGQARTTGPPAIPPRTSPAASRASSPAPARPEPPRSVAPAPSQATKPLRVAPGAAAAHPPVPVETLAGPFPRTPSKRSSGEPGTSPEAPATPGPGRTAAAAAPPIDRPAPSQSSAGGPRPVLPPGISNADVNTLYAQYVRAKRLLGEDAEPGIYGKLLRTIATQAPKIMQQYKSKGVDFSVVVKDNQVIIRAKPKP